MGAKKHLRRNGLLETIDSSKTVSDEKKAKAMIFLRHHIHDGLKDEYITKEDPCDLWKSLKERFDHQKYVYRELNTSGSISGSRITKVLVSLIPRCSELLRG